MCGGQQAHHIGAYSLLAQHLMNDVDYGSIAAVGILAALEHTGVAALETKREHIEANVRACLIDYADHTERHTHLAQTQAVRQRALRERMAEGRWQRCHMTHVGSNAFKALRGEHQSVIQRVRLVHALQIVGVGIEQGVCVIGNGIGHSQQHLVFVSSSMAASVVLAAFTCSNIFMFSASIFLNSVSLSARFCRLLRQKLVNSLTR